MQSRFDLFFFFFEFFKIREQLSRDGDISFGNLELIAVIGCVRCSVPERREQQTDVRPRT